MAEDSGAFRKAYLEALARVFDEPDTIRMSLHTGPVPPPEDEDQHTNDPRG